LRTFPTTAASELIIVSVICQVNLLHEVNQVIDENIDHYNKSSKTEHCETPFLVDEVSLYGSLQKHEA